MIEKHDDYLVPVDFYGDILTNEEGRFWFPRGKGTLFLYDEALQYKNFSDSADTVEIKFNKIIKAKVISLKPGSNPWIKGFCSSPYYFLFWIPFWNKYLINITYLDQNGSPKELFFKLKTEKNTNETLVILREKLKPTVIR